MQKTNIEWADSVWNPIRGLCPVDCKLPDGRSYCYARKMYLNPRYKWDPRVRYDYKAVRNMPKKGSKIFMCSTFEIFHPDIGKYDRMLISEIIAMCPFHTFITLTKLPQNIEGKILDNNWLGVSVTRLRDLWRIKDLAKINARIKFVSFEPLLERLYPGRWDDMLLKSFEKLSWIIIGRLTKCGHKYDPSTAAVAEIMAQAAINEIPVFLKDNLKDIPGRFKGKLIQEFLE